MITKQEIEQLKEKYPNVSFLILQQEGEYVPVFNMAYQSIGANSKKPSQGMLEINELWGDQRPDDYVIYDSYDSSKNNGVKGTIMMNGEWLFDNKVSKAMSAGWRDAITKSGI